MNMLNFVHDSVNGRRLMAEGDHYHEAERLSQRKPSLYGGEDDSPEAQAVALAQVHAMLAVADQLARVAEALDMLIQQERS
jgi:hypothetical protein